MDYLIFNHPKFSITYLSLYHFKTKIFSKDSKRNVLAKFQFSISSSSAFVYTIPTVNTNLSLFIVGSNPLIYFLVAGNFICNSITWHLRKTSFNTPRFDNLFIFNRIRKGLGFLDWWSGPFLWATIHRKIIKFS